MPLKSLISWFWDTQLALKPDVTLPDISENVQQTLDRMMGANPQLQQWIPMLVDRMGRQVVIQATDTFSTISPVVYFPASNVGTQVLFRNDRRQAATVKTLCTTNIQLAFNQADINGNSVSLNGCTIIKVLNYTGEVWVKPSNVNAVVLVYEL